MNKIHGMDTIHGIDKIIYGILEELYMEDITSRVKGCNRILFTKDYYYTLIQLDPTGSSNQNDMMISIAYYVDDKITIKLVYNNNITEYLDIARTTLQNFTTNFYMGYCELPMKNINQIGCKIK